MNNIVKELVLRLVQENKVTIDEAMILLADSVPEPTRTIGWWQVQPMDFPVSDFVFDYSKTNPDCITYTS